MFRGLRDEKGFTLPELLAVVGIVGVFAVVATILIHPVEFGPARRDAERWTGAAKLAQALSRYVQDKGALPAGLGSGEIELIGSDQDMVDLCDELTPKYIAQLPIEPVARTAGNSDCKQGGVMITGFAVKKVGELDFEVSAPLAEQDDVLVRRTF